jgi:hypothetical protein
MDYMINGSNTITFIAILCVALIMMLIIIIVGCLKLKRIRMHSKARNTNFNQNKIIRVLKRKKREMPEDRVRILMDDEEEEFVEIGLKY